MHAHAAHIDELADGGIFSLGLRLVPGGAKAHDGRENGQTDDNIK